MLLWPLAATRRLRPMRPRNRGARRSPCRFDHERLFRHELEHPFSGASGAAYRREHQRVGVPEGLEDLCDCDIFVAWIGALDAIGAELELKTVKTPLIEAGMWLQAFTIWVALMPSRWCLRCSRSDRSFADGFPPWGIGPECGANTCLVRPTRRNGQPDHGIAHKRDRRVVDADHADLFAKD